MANDLAAFARKVDKVLDEIDDPGLFRAVGLKGKQIGNTNIQADAGGDLGMSNWRRGRPINMGVRFDQQDTNTLEIGPRPGARGVAKVLNQGRQAGVSRRGRPVSASRGKGSWDRATAEMERELPKTAHDHVVKVLRKHF